VFDLPSPLVTPELLEDLYAQEAMSPPALPLEEPLPQPRAVPMNCR
jgi:hypothetical protein